MHYAKYSDLGGGGIDSDGQRGHLREEQPVSLMLTGRRSMH